MRATRDQGRQAGDVERFLRVFGKPERLLSCDCERTSEPTLAQTFQLLTGNTLQAMLARSDNRLESLLELPAERAIEELFLATLSRRPKPAEITGSIKLLNDSRTKREGYEDILWGLVNAREFLLRW